MNIGASIKAMRERVGMKQNDLAKRVNITAPYLSLIEAGKREPSAGTIDQIATALGVPGEVMLFMGLEREQVPEAKRGLFDAIHTPIKAMVTEIFISPTKS